MASMVSMAQGSEPNPPALETATASALPYTPAMGAWMIGSSILRSSLRDLLCVVIRFAGDFESSLSRLVFPLPRSRKRTTNGTLKYCTTHCLRASFNRGRACDPSRVVLPLHPKRDFLSLSAPIKQDCHLPNFVIRRILCLLSILAPKMNPVLS
jgi:hypothetical protein